MRYVIEVREDSLVKAFKAENNGEDKANGSQKATGFTTNQSGGVPEDFLDLNPLLQLLHWFLHPFGTNSSTQSASMPDLVAPKAVGAGSTAGPIPEDVFQNTISSIQVMQSLSPPTTFLSRLDQSSQAAVASTEMQPNQGSASVSSVDLPDGAVFPQATQPPVSFEMVGLPDGGVPQPFSQPGGLPPRHQMSKPPDSSVQSTSRSQFS